MAVNVHGGAGFPVTQDSGDGANVRTCRNLQGGLCVPKLVEVENGD